jgi:hypothetical protein
MTRWDPIPSLLPWKDFQWEDWYEVEAKKQYPDDQHGRPCDNSDLREAFLLGCREGYNSVEIVGCPHKMDRMQSDAYVAGVVYGQKKYDEDVDASR